jgi:NADH-quinone oxidoreductase subunit L
VRGSLLLARISYWFDQNIIDGLVNFMATVGRTIAYVDKFIDDYFVDGAVNGIASLTWNSGSMLRRVQTGHIQSYLYGALGGAIAFVIIQYVIR